MDNKCVEIGEPKQLSFAIDGLHFAAQEWGEKGQLPVLALHGWLDNSASFSALAGKLKNIHLVAIDMAGHGQSSHRHGVAPYNIWEDVAEIFAIADQLGWQEFALLGHSRGGIIATIASGTFPKRITHLALIEGIMPESILAEDAPKQLALSIKGIKTQSAKPLSVYPEVASAIAARERGMFPLSYSAAKALTERGLKTTSGGVCWSTDQRLLAPSAVKFLPEQMAAFIKQVKAPIKLILAKDGMPKFFPVYLSFLEAFPQIEVHMLPGNHHLHMEQGVDAVANIFNNFFATRP
ncbi:MAG: alpha/beta hydrolase [Pseudomonadota bacterium]